MEADVASDPRLTIFPGVLRPAAQRQGSSCGPQDAQHIVHERDVWQDREFHFGV